MEGIPAEPEEDGVSVEEVVEALLVVVDPETPVIPSPVFSVE